MPPRSGYSSFLSSLMPSGAGLMFEGMERGKANQAMTRFAANQARNLSRAGSIFGLGSSASKLGSLLLMATNPFSLPVAANMILGGAVAGIGTKFAGDKASGELSKRNVSDFMDGNVLYGNQKAADLESQAATGIRNFEDAVLPSAVQTSFTTPLTYLTMQNKMFNPYAEAKQGTDVLESYSNIGQPSGLRIGGNFMPRNNSFQLNRLFDFYTGGGY
tara:strand:- start:152 stop:802 length:651 start_codon:yes stop_codon:yes gene_type:complete